jgi:hypothetical protein
MKIPRNIVENFVPCRPYLLYTNETTKSNTPNHTRQPRLGIVTTSKTTDHSSRRP